MVPKHIFQRSLSNNVYNVWLQFKAWLRYAFSVDTSARALPPDNYDLVFEDSFNQDNLDLKEWRYGQPWGGFHSEQLWWYWPNGTTCVNTSNEGLKLSLRYFPRVFTKNQLPEWKKTKGLPNQWTSEWAAGLISSKKAYKFGWFEAEIMLPTDFEQWSAFWLAGEDSWPPEIDIFEAYTTTDLNQFKIKPNIHWGKSGSWVTGKKDYGAPRIFLKNPNERFIKYACHWTEEFIRVYYDGHLVQECTNERMLIDNSKPQYVILNHGLKKPKETKPLGSDMIIRNIKIYQNASK